jgi:protein-tyrosine phosphatase
MLNVSDLTALGHAQYPSIAAESEDAFSILAVCTGNVCRSPAVERLLAQQLGPNVSVSSAGTHALEGHPISEPMAKLLRNSGAEDRAFAARCLTERLINEADLVLTLTRAQRSLVVELVPRAVRRTFTVREFARLLGEVAPSDLPDGIPAQRLRIAIPLAIAQRGIRLASPDDDDVTDPFRLSDDIYATSFAEIASAVNVIVETLLPGGHESSQ